MLTVMPRDAPFPERHQLSQVSERDMNALDSFLLGHPRVLLRDSGALVAFLKRELHGADLDRLAPKLWMMSEQSSANISPLHRQAVKNRQIIITEDPQLHLVWFSKRMFLKPLPRYLLSYDFWRVYLLSSSSVSPLGCSAEQLCREALGYIRTYYHLIQYESDFRIAVDTHLIPAHITWEEFCAFSSSFNMIPDSRVSARYAYGELRLSRLNFYCKLFLGKQYFHRIYLQTDEYFSRFYATILFLLAIGTVLLTAMQLEVQVRECNRTSLGWFSILSRLITVPVLVCGLCLLVSFAFMYVHRQVREWGHALYLRYARTRVSDVPPEKSQDEDRGEEV